MILAIDGPAGSGKSTLASRIAENFGFFNLNSGEFYRAFALAHISKGRRIDNKDDIDNSLKDINLSLVGENVAIDGKVVPKNELHTNEVDNASSVLSVIVDVRKRINDLLRQSVEGKNVVCEGRDITSIVFPNAEVKIYLDASLEERAKRRATERGGDVKAVCGELETRDTRDKTKEFGALKIVEDAVVIDTTHLTINEVYNKICTILIECLDKTKNIDK